MTDEKQNTENTTPEHVAPIPFKCDEDTSRCDTPGHELAE